MAVNVVTLGSDREWFLLQKRIDPLTRRVFVRGDRVVVCDGCKTVHLESSWDDAGGCSACGGRSTRKSFLRAQREPTRLTIRPPTGTPPRPVSRSSGDTPPSAPRVSSRPAPRRPAPSGNSHPEPGKMVIVSRTDGRGGR